MHRFKYSNLLVALLMLFAILRVPTQAHAEEAPLSVAGSREVGQTLQIQEEGNWDNPPDIQWLRDLQPIEGATTNTYQLGSKDYLRSVTVRAVGTYDGSPKVRFSLPIERTEKGDFVGTLGEQPLGMISSFNQACAAQMGGAVQCVGYNQYGELGDGSIANTLDLTPTPVTARNLRNVVSVSTSGYSSCALIIDGTARCWGTQLYQEGPVSPLLTPEKVEGLEGAIALAQGGQHNCALLTGGSISCWGTNYHGELGDGTFTGSMAGRLNAVTLENIAGVVEITLGEHSTCAMIFDGSVSCWGYNYFGQLATGDRIDRLIPTPVIGLSPVLKISSGFEHVCSLMADRTVECWGSNEEFESGDRSGFDPILEPRKVIGLSDIKNVFAGEYKSCVIKSDGALWCWGLAPLGDGTYSNHRTERSSDPVRVVAFGEIDQVFIGPTSCIVTKTGGTYCWGYGAGIGTGRSDEITSPTPTLFNKWLTLKSIPAVAGDTHVGSTLLVNQGIWDSGVSLTYQWFSNGSEIDGAEDDHLIISNELAGTKISLLIEASKEGYLSHFAESPNTPIVTGGKISTPLALVISGVPKFNEILKAMDYAWDPTVTLSYTWQREGSGLVLGRGQNYVVGMADVGKRIRLTLSATKLGHDTVMLTSPYSSKITLRSLTSPPVPSIAGTLKVGKSVTAAPGVWVDNPTLSYQWLLDGKPISKATKATLKIPSSAKNRKLSVRVTATKSGFVSVSKSSSVKKVS